jgi:UrcA family protein
MSIKFPIFTACAVSALTLATSALAAPPLMSVVVSDHTYSVRVPLGDLDLTHEANAVIAFGRIHYAAKLVCGPDTSNLDLTAGAAYRACVRSATQHAVGRLGAPLVIALAGRQA